MCNKCREQNVCIKSSVPYVISILFKCCEHFGNGEFVAIYDLNPIIIMHIYTWHFYIQTYLQSAGGLLITSRWHINPDRATRCHWHSRHPSHHPRPTHARVRGVRHYTTMVLNWFNGVLYQEFYGVLRIEYICQGWGWLEKPLNARKRTRQDYLLAMAGFFGSSLPNSY